MSSEQLTSLVQAAAALVQALGWPLLVLFLALYFGVPLKKFLNDIGEFTFKAGAAGVEATAKRKVIEAAAFLGAASASRSSSTTAESDEEKTENIAKVVSQADKPRLLERLSRARVLWVDDNPSNNLYERRALEALGLQIGLSTNTNDAIDRLRNGKYDVIISDMGRPPDRLAGYALLAEKQKLGDKTTL